MEKSTVTQPAEEFIQAESRPSRPEVKKNIAYPEIAGADPGKSVYDSSSRDDHSMGGAARSVEWEGHPEARKAMPSGSHSRKPHLRPLGEQRVVIAGASSGMGRVIAKQFASTGASVCVAARSLEGLQSLVDEINAARGHALAVTADVANYEDVLKIAETARAAFGGIDTWVQVAGTGIYSTFEETTPEEFDRVVRVNLLGVAHGLKAALENMPDAGSLIVISSVEGVISLPYHSAYAAAKHGVNGLVDALRLELERTRPGVHITNVMPAGVNTPFFNNVRTRLGVKPKPPRPVYEPEDVAACVLYAAQHPVRELFVGGGAKAFEIGKRFFPRALEKYLHTAFQSQRTSQDKSEESPSGLYAPERSDERVHGDFKGIARRSVYTWIQTHRRTAGLALLGALGVVAGMALRRTP